MLSCIIPCHKDKDLQRTIDDILTKAHGEIEIIAVLDGYQTKLKDDPRVKTLRHGCKKGLRAAINHGVAISSGEYLMKCDAHCVFDDGFDVKVLKDIQDNWIVIPRMYRLDTEKWEVMDDCPIDISRLVYLASHNKLHGEEWRSRSKEREHIPIDATMSFQGSCWFMARSWWDKIGPMDIENYGTFTQEPVELGLSTWKLGGRTMVNKNTWYAHKHRKFNRTHRLKSSDLEKGNQYALKTWRSFVENELPTLFYGV